jgi:uncharacterized protein (TIGR03437 family)
LVFCDLCGTPQLTFGSYTADVLSTDVDGNQVRFDGVKAAIIYSDQGIFAVQAPVEIAGKTTTFVTVVNAAGAESLPVAVPVYPVDRSVLTQDSSGGGDGAIQNEDGTLNSAENPARIGSTITVYYINGGITNPQVPNGAVNPVTSLLPTFTIGGTWFIGGLPAQSVYDGPAPGSLGGVAQANLKVPASLPAGPANLSWAPSGNTQYFLGKWDVNVHVKP